MIRKEFRWKGLPFLCTTSVPAVWDLVVFGKNCTDFQAPPGLPLPTADSITQWLLLSVKLVITLLHMTRVM